MLHRRMETILKYKIFVTTAAVTVFFAAVLFTVLKYKRRKASEAFHYMNISIITDEEACDGAVTLIRRKCIKQNAVGFDCEWVTVAGKRQPVALLQLSTVDGFCGLFRLNQMKTVPSSLKALLEDNTIYKVGVSPSDDAKYLFQDYGAKLKSSFDVRHLARACGHSAGGLASLSEALLQVTLDKHWQIRCSDWEAEQLTDRQVNYAAADAHIAIKMFVKLIGEYTANISHSSYWFSGKADTESLQSANYFCRDYADVAFKTKHNTNKNTNEKKERYTNKGDVVLSKRYPHSTRSKPLYNNCYLQAPDGELLCTCDKKKALWYVEKDLAAVVSAAPLTVRLRFEPAGRSVGAAGRYYQLAKENKCVVCGTTDSYIRKNVVPREYRKYFPEVMKDHSSHDVVLLCIRCHQLSNALDLRMREMLARKCDAPLSSDKAKPRCDFQTRKIRSAARALLYNSRSLPEARRRALELELRAHYPRRALSADLLREAALAGPDVTLNAEEETHGMRVVDYHLKHEGLLRLEEYWREHFLASMEPKYMPELWSIKHNEERLRVKFDEGRLSVKDLQSIGLTAWT